MTFTRVRAASGAAHEFDAPTSVVLAHPERYERIKAEDVEQPRPPVFKSVRRAAVVEKTADEKKPAGEDTKE